MASSTSRGIKLTLFVLALVVLGASAIGYFYFQARPDWRLKLGESAMAKGEAAFASKDTAAAIKAFDEAKIQAQKTLDGINRKLATVPKESDEAKKLEELAGRTFLLRATAMRDLAHAKALADGKPLSEIDDITTGEKYRSYAVISDSNEMNEVLSCLREAAKRLPTDAELQKNTLRTELTMAPMNWPQIDEACKRIIEIDPKDSRAHYLLARYEFEQPRMTEKGIEIMAPERRVASRVKRARDHLEKSKASGKFPLWRTLYLQAQITGWLAADANKQGRTADKDREDRDLRALLFDASTGAVQRARDGEDMGRMHPWDVTGVLSLTTLAVELSLADRKSADPSETARVMNSMAAFLSVADKLVQDVPGRIGEVADSAVANAQRMQPVWADQPTAATKGQVDQVRALAKKALEAKAVRPSIYTNMAMFDLRQSYLERKRNNNDEAAKLEAQAESWLANGLKVGQDSKVPEAALAELHVVSAETKALKGKREDVAPHLDALRRIPKAEGRKYAAMADLVDGTLAEREGRLDIARETLERVLASDMPNLTTRANLALAGIYLATNQPERAVTSLETVEKVFTSLEQLSPQERAWVGEFVQKPSQISGYLAIAHLNAATARIAAFFKANPGKTIPGDIVTGHERAVAQVLKQVPAPDPVNQYVRQQLVAYLVATKREQAADEQLATLEKDYPDSLEVLKQVVSSRFQKLAVAAAADKKKPQLDDATRKEIDDKIRQFMARYGEANRAARLYWAEWLTRSGRAPQALLYLNDPANFPGEKESAYLRLLAAARFGSGEREAALKLLESLPENPANDLVAIQIVTSHEDQQKKLGQALAKYENNGVFRIWQSKSDLNAGKFTEAATGFFQALDFTKVRQMAADGLLRSLMALTQQDPMKARETIAGMLKTNPTEPALLLPLAYSHLLTDEIGSPEDSYTNTKTMAGALNLWQAAFLRANGEDKASAVSQTRARFWMMANRLDQARAEAQRALQVNPKDVPALMLMAGLDVDAQNPALLPNARQTLTAVLAEQPENVAAQLLLAVVDERENKLDAAIASLEKMIEKNSKFGVAISRLAELLLKKGAADQAMAVTRKWRKALPMDASAAEMEVFLLAKAKDLVGAKRVTTEFTSTAVAAAKEQAAKKPPVGVDLTAWEKQQKLVVEGTESAAQLSCARGLLRAGSFAEAFAIVQSVLDKHPTHQAALLLKGDALMSQKKNAEAKALYSKIVEVNPNHYIAGNNLAWMLAEDGDAAKAYEVAQNVRRSRFTKKPVTGDRLDPSFLDTLGAVYQKLATPEKFAEMRETFESAVRRYPSDPRLQLHLGNAYAALKQMEQAEQVYARADELAAPNSPALLDAEAKKEVAKKIAAARAKLKADAPK